MRRRALVAAGVLLMAGAALWRFRLAEHWTQRLPPGWEWKADFVGTLTFADPKTGRYPLKDVTSTYERSQSIVSDADRPKSVQIEDRYTIRDPATGQKTWEFIARLRADPKTGARCDRPRDDEQFVFPRHTGKKPYLMSFSYLNGIPLTFQGEERVEGLETYRFAYRGRVVYTESYAGTADFPGVKVPPGQDIRCSDDQYVLKMWIEPTTGEVLKLEESCYSGDSIYDTAADRRVAPVARWGGETMGDDVVFRAEAIRAHRRRYLLAALFAPVTLTLAALFSFIMAVLPRRTGRDAPTDPSGTSP